MSFMPSQAAEAMFWLSFWSCPLRALDALGASTSPFAATKTTLTM
jgi:hypothetical protein